MEDALKRTFKRILHDIRHGKNLENYVVSALALVLAILTTIDIAKPALQQAVILAALALLVFNLSSTHQTPQHLTIDHFLNDRSDFIPFEDLIKNAKTLWIYAPSAISILNDMHTRLIHQIILAKPEGEFRIIIQDPQEQAALDILIRQLDDNVKFPLQDMHESLRRTIAVLEKVDSWQKAGKFSYRFLPFNPGFSLVAVDPLEKHGRLIVEFYGFTHDHVTSRMHLQLTREQSERWYNYWLEQFTAMWDTARPPEQT